MSKIKQMKGPEENGFTLVEILIALFIFSIISLLLMSGLHTVITAQSVTENKAERLRELQMAMLVISRDIEQAVNRPIINAQGQEEAAFTGDNESFHLTHTGFANLPGKALHPSLQRTAYLFDENYLVRINFDALDQTPESKSHKRKLLAQVSGLHFQYLDQQGRFADKWPMDSGGNQVLPRAVKIELSLARFGKISQLYLIPAQNEEH